MLRTRRADAGASGAVLWATAGLYTVAVVVPLFVILIGSRPPERSFWVEFGVAIGFIGLAMLCFQSVLTARYPRLSSAIGQDTMLQFHRQAGIVAFAFVLAHPVVLLLANSDYWAFLDPRDNFLRAIFLIFALFALPVLIVTSLWREWFRLPYQWWRLGHGALAGSILVVGLVHITRVHHYLADPWKQVLWVALGSASVTSILYVRAIKPLQARRRPYRVVEVTPLAERTWTLAVEPVDPPGVQFEAGQFVFLTIADQPFALEQHPFSVASSPQDGPRLEFAIKELGDFTSTIGDTAVGQQAFVDGPYGSMRLPDDPDSPLLLVAGGIGIAPAMSMLRSLRHQQRAAPVVVIYAANRADELAFSGELDLLQAELPLTVTRVLREPPATWDGATGQLDAGLVDLHLPEGDLSSWHAVLCGPPQMMDVAERALVARGVPLRQVHSERFDIGAAGAVGQRGAQVRRMVLGLSVVLLGAAVLFAA